LKKPGAKESWNTISWFMQPALICCGDFKRLPGSKVLPTRTRALTIQIPGLLKESVGKTA